MDLITDLSERLCGAYGFRREGAYLRKGRCPECGAKELWTQANRPYVLFCARLNKCGAHIPVKALFPELFNQFQKHHPSTQADPHATARAYLRSRGLDPVPFLREGSCLQGSRGVEIGEGQWKDFASVKFLLSNGSACHRLIDYGGKDKNRFEGPYKGQVWAPADLKQSEEIWVTEGILDALSLIQVGLPAVAVISASHLPRPWLDRIAQSKARLVLAHDNDPAGRKGAAKMAAVCETLRIEHQLAFAPPGLDWNDLLLRGELDRTSIKKTLELARWRGALAGASSAEDYYNSWRSRKTTPIFEYQGCYWRGRNTKDKVEVKRLSDFTLEPVFALQRKVGAGRLEHAMRVLLRNHRAEYETTLESRQWTNQKEFKSAVWSAAMVNWNGRQDELDLVLDQAQAKRPMVVREVGVVGYEADSDCYLFPDGAYGPDGSRYEADSNGFFNVSGKRFLLSVSEDEKAIAPDAGISMADLLRLLRQAYGNTALAALGFYTASLFAEQFSCRPATRFFPFLSFYGPPGTGKSALINILNTLMGRAVDEGLSVEEVDTAKGTTRLMASVSNLPIAILEMDQAKAKRFNMNRLLTLYNRAPLQTRANRSQDLTVNTLRFRGTLVFAQNVEQFQGEAQRGRVVSLPFYKERQNQDTLQALIKLQNLAPGELAVYRQELLSRRQEILKSFLDRYQHYARLFQVEGIENTRIANNHAVLAAGAHVALQAFLPDSEAQQWSQELTTFLLKRAQEKLASLKTDSDYFSLFFEIIARLIQRGKITNHCDKGQEVWLNMGEVKEVFEAEHIQFNFQQLFTEFENSPHVRFRNSSKHSPLTKKTTRLYGFDRAALHPTLNGE